MITLKITKDGESCPIDELVTDSRKLARDFVLLAAENELDVEATEEMAPRVIKFKGVS